MPIQQNSHVVALPKIPPIEHRCVVSSGPMGGNTHVHFISALDILYGGVCENCKQDLVTAVGGHEAIIGHFYEHLVEND